jgi:Flp pilus assembly protein TadG
MSIAFSRIRNFGRSNAGSSAVEFAIAAPILFALMFAVIEFGRAWWTKNALQYAIERAARYAVVCNGGCPGDAAVQTYAANQVYDQTVQSTAFSVTHPDATTSCVNYNFTYAPWFAGHLAVLSGSMAMTGKTCRTHS